MKIFTAIFFAAISWELGLSLAHADYEEPSPLRDIEIHVDVSRDKALFRYVYTLTNPSKNDGDIFSVDIFLPRDLQKDAALSKDGLQQCKRYHRKSSERIMSQVPVVPVGSEAPNGWSCGYAHRQGYAEGAFGWGAIDDPYTVKPGKSLAGLVLTSFGLPGIRDVRVEPEIDTDRLSQEYEENLAKTVALEERVKWMGKTVAPVAPPVQVAPYEYVNYIMSLAKQSSEMGWIVDEKRGISNRLIGKLENARKEFERNKPREAIKILRSFLQEVEMFYQKDSKKRLAGTPLGTSQGHLTSESYALLKYNASFLVEKVMSMYPLQKNQLPLGQSR